MPASQKSIPMPSPLPSAGERLREFLDARRRAKRPVVRASRGPCAARLCIVRRRDSCTSQSKTTSAFEATCNIDPPPEDSARSMEARTMKRLSCPTMAAISRYWSPSRSTTWMSDADPSNLSSISSTASFQRLLSLSTRLAQRAVRRSFLGVGA